MDYFKKIERSVTISADKRSTVDLQVDVWSQDLNVTKFILKLDTTDSAAIDLANATVRVAMVYSQDGKDVKIEAAGIVEDVATQKIAYIMDGKLAGFEGTVTSGFYVTLSTGQRIDIQNVTFNMRKSLLDKDLDVPTEDYYQTFDDIVADVQQTGETAKTQIANVLPSVQSKVSAINAELAKIDENMPDLFVAYANSADGTIDFTKIKPNDNLVTYKDFEQPVNCTFNVGVLTTNQPNTDKTTLTIYLQAFANYTAWIKDVTKFSTMQKQTYSSTFTVETSYLKIYNDAGASIFIDMSSLIGLKITLSFNVVDNRPGYAVFDKIKIEKGDQKSLYLPSKYDNYRDSFMKYIGYSVKNSNNPSDYRWQVNPEWQRAQLDYERAVVDNYLNINLNASTIYSKSKMDSNPINSILTTLSTENPSTTLGGTWSQLGTETKFSNTIYYWKRTN